MPAARRRSRPPPGRHQIELDIFDAGFVHRRHRAAAFAFEDYPNGLTPARRRYSPASGSPPLPRVAKVQSHLQLTGPPYRRIRSRRVLRSPTAAARASASHTALISGRVWRNARQAALFERQETIFGRRRRFIGWRSMMSRRKRSTMHWMPNRRLQRGGGERGHVAASDEDLAPRGGWGG
jgi:hypothetical protein